jgi:hypothetical protein
MKTTVSILMALCVAASADVVTLAHPCEALPHEKTVVWSPLFQATWDKLNTELGGKPEKVEPPNELMSKLDSFKWETDKIMPAGSWKTWSGPATADFLKRVNEEAAKMTGEAQGPFRLSREDEHNRSAFGLLDRVVSFQKAFLRSRSEPMAFRAGDNESPVCFFGSRGDMSGELRDNVRILAFRPVDRSHAIQILCKEADDSVVLYRPAKPMDFATACSWIRTWRTEATPDMAEFGAWNDALLHETDEVRIPYVDLESTVDLTSKLKCIRMHRNKPWIIGRAEQKTRFQLHEKGARVRVEVSLDAFALAEPQGPRIIPRKFIYDRPFFVFLWRDGAEWPYFGAWIGDTSAMKAFQ